MSVTPPLPKWADLFVLPILNLLAAFVICGLIICVRNPISALVVMIGGVRLSRQPRLYALLHHQFCLHRFGGGIAFHAMMFNIGGEGQAYLGLVVWSVSAGAQPGVWHCPAAGNSGCSGL